MIQSDLAGDCKTRAEKSNDAGPNETRMRSRALETYKATLMPTPRQRALLVGLLLGDGHIEQSPCTPRARLKVEQRAGAPGVRPVVA